MPQKSLRKLLCSVLVFSWLILSAIDILEDLRFDHSSTIYKSAAPRLPGKKKQPILVHDSVELAKHQGNGFEEITEDKDLKFTADEIFLHAYLESKATRTQKDRYVFRI